MSARSINRFFSLLVLVALLLQPLAVTGKQVDEETRKQGVAAPAPETGLYRTTVTVDSPARRARLEALGVIVLTDEGRTTEDELVVLADADQLEALARLRFEPRATDDADALVASHAAEKPALAAAWGELRQRIETDKRMAVAAASLSAYPLASVAALSSIDDDADGLTNTEEAWWCTDPLNPNSDGDAQGYTDGQEVAALLDFTLSRTVRWGYGPPFGPPNAWPNFNDRNGTHVNVCNDGDWDTIPDYAEVFMVGTRVPEESTDRDKFDDGQELFGITYCPGAPTNCGYGSYPAIEYWNWIQARMPEWVLPPGDNPLVAAFPVPEVSVTPGSWHVERVTTITTSQGEITEIRKDYQTSVTRGESSSIADTVNWNNWEEVSESIETPMGQSVVTSASVNGPAGFWQRAWGATRVVGGVAAGVGLGAVAALGAAGCAPTAGAGCLVAGAAGVGVAGSLAVAGQGWQDLWGPNQVQEKQQSNHYSITNVNQNSVRTTTNVVVPVMLNQNFDTQGIVASLDGVQYAINQQGELLSRGLQDISYQLSRPRFTETRTNGSSWGGAQTTTHEVYEEHTQTEGVGFTTGQNWSTAWAVDSSHAADLTFEFSVKNTGTEYARELSGIVVNVYIGDDTSPSISYPAWEKFPNGKLENLFPVGPNTPSGQFSVRTFTTNPIALSLEQMKRIDLGERLTVKVESYSYGADELFYTNAVTGGVTVFIEDGVEDGDETVDSYVIPTWGVESVQDVLTRYFRCPPGQTCTDADGNLNALWTPEYDGVNPPTWHEHYLSDIAWWNVYLTQADAGDTSLQALPARAGSGILFRFNRDADRDGYNDRAEFRYYCALPADDPDRARCADAHLRPEIHPQPEVSAGYVAARSGNVVTVKLAVANSGTFDAYGIDAVMYSPDGTTTIGNNTVGGNGRVRPGNHVAVGSLIKEPDRTNWGASTAKPYAGGQFSGAADRTFTFTAATPGVVGQGATAMTWSDGADGSGPLNLGSSYHAPLPVDVAQGLQIGLNTGTIAAGARFTVPALTPRDTFTYTVVSEPFTPPVIAVSYSDPQGSHRFVTPVELASLDATIAAGQMLEGLKVEIVTPAAFNAAGANTTNLVVNNPHPVTIQGGHLYLNFVSDGKLVREKSYTLDLPAGPTVFPADWSVTEFSADYHPNGDNLLIAFWTDSEGNIIDSAARPLNSFAEDPKPAFAMADADATWDFGTAAQGTLLKRSFTFANTGSLDLLTYVSAPAGLTVSQTGSRRVGPADMTTYEMALNTANLSVGAYDGTITIRTSDPDARERTVHVAGTVTVAPADTPVGAMQRPLDVAATVTGTQGQWVEFTHTLGPEPQTLHPVKVYSQDYTSLKGVGKYATSFGQGTASYDMFGDGRDGDLVVAPGQVAYVDDTRISVAGVANAGQTQLPVTSHQVYQTIWIDGTAQWVDTGLTVSAGQTLRLSAQRVICYDNNACQNYMFGPDGNGQTADNGWLTPGLIRLSLVGRIGSGPAFFVGSSLPNMAVQYTGRLYLAYNDTLDGFVGNRGAYFVQITAFTPGAIPDVFAGGQEVLVIQVLGPNAGYYEYHTVRALTNGAIELATPLQHDYSSAYPSRAQVIRVPNYRNVTIQAGGVLSAHAWDGNTGGVLVFRSNGMTEISGSADVSGKGYRGGFGPIPTWSNGYQGEGWQGYGTYSAVPNGNGGGGGEDGKMGTGAGGGGHTTDGGDGGRTENGYRIWGGTAVGDQVLSRIYFGGGGGEPGDGEWSNLGPGGSGGGAALIHARSLRITGSVIANGAAGQNITNNYFWGGSGAGGSILVQGSQVNLGTGIAALGGPQQGSGRGMGGYGSAGRIHVEYCDTAIGSTNPTTTPEKLNCYIADQATDPTHGLLQLPASGAHTYQVQYGRKLNWGGAANQVTSLRVPAGLFTSVTLQSLVSDLPSNAWFALDVGNTGSDSWSGTVSNGGEYTSPNLAAYFNAYWATYGGAPTAGYLDVPVRAHLDRAGQVLLTNLQVTPTGSKTRAIRLPVPSQGYSSVAASFTVSGGAGPLAVGVDVGGDGSVDWTYTGSPAYPASLITGNLAAAVNAYLASLPLVQGGAGGGSDPTDVPIRFYLSPFVTLNLTAFTATPVGQPDASIGAGDVTFDNIALIRATDHPLIRSNPLPSSPTNTDPVEGDTLTINAAIHNAGSLDTGPFTAAFYATPAGGTAWYIGSAFAANVSPGSESLVTLPWNTLDFTGPVTITVTADPYNRVAESNEGNNVVTATVTIRTRPDLSIPTIALSDPEPVAGETVTVTLTVRNAGQTASGASTAALYDGNPDAGGTAICQPAAGVPGASQANLTCTWTPLRLGLHRLFARADRNRQVNESDEGNNDRWLDVYVGFGAPVALDSGAPAADPAYTAALGYGAVDTGLADAVVPCAGRADPTLRRDPSNRVGYRFDHLQPGRFYHLDIVLYECDNNQRVERVLVNDLQVAGPVALGDQAEHRLSIRLDPAAYREHVIEVAVIGEEGSQRGAVVASATLREVDYRYSDSGGPNDPAYTVGRGWGYLDANSVAITGTLPYLPYRSARVDQDDAELRYRFDRLDPAKRYQVSLTFWQATGNPLLQRVRADGLDTPATVNLVAGAPISATVRLSPAAYATDGSVVVSVVLLNAGTGATVNEISLEEETLLTESPCHVQETPNVSHALGGVIVNGIPAPIGTVVTAESPRGDIVGCYVVGSDDSPAGQYGFMPIYGEDPTAAPPIPGMREGELVTFRVDGALGQATPPFYWHNDPAEHWTDLVAMPLQGQSILLPQTWNLLSFRVEPPVPLVGAALGSIASKYDRVLGETGIYDTGVPSQFQTLTELHAGRGYYLRLTVPSVNLLIEGSPLAGDTPLPLHQGWNWIGYLPQSTLPITTALASIAGAYQRVLSIGQYYDTRYPTFSTLKQLSPGQGYLLYATRGVTLTYPAALASGVPDLSGNVPPRQVGDSELSDPCRVAATPDLTILYGALTVAGAPAPVGARVEALTPAGEVAGCAVVDTPGQYGFMFLYGADAAATPPIPGFRAGEPVRLRVNGQAAALPAAVVWQGDRAPHRLDLAVGGWKMWLPAVGK